MWIINPHSARRCCGRAGRPPAHTAPSPRCGRGADPIGERKRAVALVVRAGEALAPARGGALGIEERLHLLGPFGRVRGRAKGAQERERADDLGEPQQLLLVGRGRRLHHGGRRLGLLLRGRRRRLRARLGRALAVSAAIAAAPELAAGSAAADRDCRAAAAASAPARAAGPPDAACRTGARRSSAPAPAAPNRAWRNQQASAPWRLMRVPHPGARPKARLRMPASPGVVGSPAMPCSVTHLISLASGPVWGSPDSHAATWAAITM